MSSHKIILEKSLLIIAIAIILGGCSLNKRPEWEMAGNSRMQAFQKYYLTDTKRHRADIHFENALGEIKKSGDLDLMQKAWLTRMALQVAVLKEVDGDSYRQLEDVLSVPENENYFRFLTAAPYNTINASLLPSQYTSFFKALQKGDTSEAEQAIAP